MGLLTDTGNPTSFTLVIKNHATKLSFLSYFAGIVWFGLLAYEPYNARTYFSENALLPGLVQREFNLGTVASQVLETLRDEAGKRNGIPYGYLQAQFHQLGLDVYYHNFTLNYPFGSKTKFTGKNLYAVLRAPRTGSLEAIVLSTPYRDSSNTHGSTLPSIALMLSLAKFFRQQIYWAKDIIFLIAEHELVGFQAFLEAYHKESIAYGHDKVLDYGELLGRSGAIQAAINLEISAERVPHLDICLQGLNGQLPNLDLFNLLVEMCMRESVIATFHNQPTPPDSDSFDGWKSSMKTMLQMMATQSSGTPSGAHGLFHRYAIQALTLKSKETNFNMPKATFTQIGRVIEGSFRSLNNLLERFHQSFFFYLLSSPRRYISIGMYMPAFDLIALPVLIQALTLYHNMLDGVGIDGKGESPSLWSSLPTVLISHTLGCAMCCLPQALDLLASYLSFTFKDTLYFGLIAFMLMVQSLPIFYTAQRKMSPKEKMGYKCIALLAFGSFLYTLSLVNISMATFIAVVFVPILTTTGTFQWRILRFLHSLLLWLIQPLSLTFVLILAYSFTMSQGSIPWTGHFRQAYEGHRNLVLWNVEDWYLYANYNFLGVTLVLTPVWLQFWYLPS